MGSFGGFYKGEKKKAKKTKDIKRPQSFSSAPSFKLPELISRKKKDY